MKWRAGMQAYTWALVPSDKPRAEGDLHPFKFITVLAGVIESIQLERRKKVSVSVAMLKVSHLADGLFPMEKDSISIKVVTEDLRDTLAEALSIASDRYRRYRERTLLDLEYISERVDTNAAHLAGLNEAQIWGIVTR